MPKIILNDPARSTVDFASPFMTKLYALTLQLDFANQLLNRPSGYCPFTHHDLPNSADLAFVKSVVWVLRTHCALQLAQTEALNKIASTLGHKHFASLQAAVPSVIENSAERSNKLPGIFFWVYCLLCEDQIVQDVEMASRRMLEAFIKALDKPVFSYDFARDGRFDAGVMTIYPNGLLLDKSGPQDVYHDVARLSLLAVDYKVAAANLVDLASDAGEAATKTQVFGDEMYGDEGHLYIAGKSGSAQSIHGVLALPQATQDDLFLAASMRFPAVNNDWNPEARAQAIIRDFPGKRLFCRLQSKHLKDVYGHDQIMLGFSGSGASGGLTTGVDPKSAMEMRLFSSQGFYKPDDDDGEPEVSLWKMGLSAPGAFKARQAK